MGRRKVKIEFNIKGHGKRKFVIGEVYRFKWKDLFRALQAVHNELPEGNFKTQMEAIINSSRELIHDTLYAVLEAILQSGVAKKNLRIRVAGWVIACYGYCRGLPVPTENSTWPLPRELRRLPKPRFQDIREQLHCTICGKFFIPPRRYRTRKAILNWFVGKITSHMRTDHKK